MTHVKVDMDRVAQLLGIVEGVAKVAPGFTHISSEAMAELRQINKHLNDEADRKAGRVPAPAPVGDKDSPAPNMGSESPENPALDPHPTASAPVESALKDDPKPPRAYPSTPVVPSEEPGPFDNSVIDRRL